MLLRQLFKKSAWLLHPNFVTRLHLLHAIVVRLHVCKVNVVSILTLETAATVGV